MSGCIIVLTVFTIYLLPESYASLATFANRVLKCPDPHNVSEWEQASVKLNCLHPLRGGSSMQLARVYHCLPSNYLNESLEYCGNSGPVAKGNCPVYKYGDGRNRAASYRSCANFTSGCPEEQYHSKDVYMYPACLNINPVDKCYVAEPMCEKNFESATDNIDLLSTESDRRDNDKDVIDHTQISSTGSNVMIVVIVILLVIIIGLVSFILWKKKTILCPMFTTSKDKRVHYNAENQSVDMETDTSENNESPLLPDPEITITKEAFSDPSQQNGSIVQQQVHYNAENQSVDMETDTSENNESPLLPDPEITITKATSQSVDDIETDAPDGDDILNMPFNIFLGEVGREISREALTKLKDHLKASEKKIEKQRIDEIASGSEVIDLMHEKYDFNINLYLLQSILELIGEERLAELCVNFGKNFRRLYYYKGDVNVEGYREVVLKVDKSIDDYHREDLERIRRRLLTLLSGPEPNDIVFKEIAEGCIAIHALVRQKVVDMIKSEDISSLCKDCVVEVNVVGECKRSLGITEKDVSLSCFEVSFDYGPTALTTHKRVADKLQQHRETMGLVDVRFDSVIIVHHTKLDLSDIVLELFESEPIIHGERKYNCVQNVDAVGNIVIFCYDRLSQDIIYQTLKAIVLGEDCKEINFIYCLEKCEEMLESKMDMGHILQPQGDKSHLYNAYCVRVEEEFKLFKKDLHIACFPAIVSSLEKLEQMLNSHNKKQEIDPGGNVVAMNYLREMESYGIIGCMTDDGVLRMFGQTIEDKNDAILEHLKVRKENDNIDIVLNSITFYSLELSGSNEARLLESDTVYYEDGGLPKTPGTRICPYISDETHLEHLSVLRKDEKLCCLVEKELKKEIKIFDGELRDLINRKVYKYGAKSGYTVGYIEHEFHMLRNRALIVKGEGCTCFADSGDSGAVVLTKIGMDTFAIGIVVGCLGLYEETKPMNPILVLSLKDSLHQFTEDLQV